jgi:phosphonate metabolism protein PhnN/1,5-bisphosphokinase (PRPP-forming)
MHPLPASSPVDLSTGRPQRVIGRGTLFLVVGPSGAGKDTLLRHARPRLEETGNFVFARRAITRPREGAREDHEPVTADEFAERARQGRFMLTWKVYDTDYGIPAGYADDLAAGRHVIANVSRMVVARAVDNFAPARVIQITAPREVLRERLRARADPATAAARLARAVVLPDGIPVTHLLNIGDLDTGAARLMKILNAD